MKTIGSQVIMSKTVVAIDPGETTGIVKVHKSGKLMWHGDLDGLGIFDCRKWNQSDVIIIEAPVLTGSITDGKVAQIKAIGIIELISHILFMPIVYIQPSETKSIKKLPDDVDKIIKGHARDAYRVYMAWQRKGD